VPARLFVRRTQVEVPQGRLKIMMSGARHGMRNAAGRIRPTTSRARGKTAVRIMNARGWTAPQFHRAAHFVDASMAPRISAILTGTARRIEPMPPRRSMGRMALGTLGILVLLGAVGAATVRRRSQMADLLEPEDGMSYEERSRSNVHTPEHARTSDEGRSGIGSSSEGERFGSGSWVGRGSGTSPNRGVGRP